MLLLLLCAFAVVTATPLQGKEREIAKHALENSNLLDGDIAESFEDIGDRNVMPERFRWPTSTVPYELDPSLFAYKDMIQEAIDSYHSKTCLRFVPRTDEEDYIYMVGFDNDGCWSRLGKTGGKQLLSLGYGCKYVGTIIHEIGHAIGFWHEQARSDRDDYLEILWDNIHPEQFHNFEKRLPNENILLTPFDYDSIMIYGHDTFSKNGKWTMKAKNGRKLVDPFDKYELNASDIKRINIMYKC